MLLTNYRGRFAPSPTGLLHTGSLATALASWLDAKAFNGVWLVRIEDVDTTRAQPDASEGILQQLALFGLLSDEPVIFQSNRYEIYADYLTKLIKEGLIYSCTCSRKKIQDHYEILGKNISTHEELVYPGFCRSQPIQFDTKQALRIKTPENAYVGEQLLNKEVGDFAIRRADGIFTYQIAVVIDDHLQGINHVVRGADLASNTPRQIWLQQILGFKTPQYMHIPLILDQHGNKLSKQNKAKPLWPKSNQEILSCLTLVAHHLGLDLPDTQPTHLSEWLHFAVCAWRDQKNTRDAQLIA